MYGSVEGGGAWGPWLLGLRDEGAGDLGPKERSQRGLDLEFP